MPTVIVKRVQDIHLHVARPCDKAPAARYVVYRDEVHPHVERPVVHTECGTDTVVHLRITGLLVEIPRRESYLGDNPRGVYTGLRPHLVQREVLFGFLCERGERRQQEQKRQKIFHNQSCWLNMPFGTGVPASPAAASPHFPRCNNYSIAALSLFHRTLPSKRRRRVPERVRGAPA